MDRVALFGTLGLIFALGGYSQDTKPEALASGGKLTLKEAKDSADEENWFTFKVGDHEAKTAVVEFFGRKLIQAGVMVQAPADKKLFHFFHMAFFDKDTKLVAAGGVRSEVFPGTKAGQSALIELPLLPRDRSMVSVPQKQNEAENIAYPFAGTIPAFFRPHATAGIVPFVKSQIESGPLQGSCIGGLPGGLTSWPRLLSFVCLCDWKGIVPNESRPTCARIGMARESAGSRSHWGDGRT